MKLHIAMSAATDVDRAAREAVREARSQASSPAFALAFCTDAYDADALASAVTRELVEVPWAGCCSAGVFAGTKLVRQGVVVGVLEGDDVSFAVGVGGPISADPRAAGIAAVHDALAAARRGNGRAHRSFLLFPDALTGNAAEVIRGAVQQSGAGAAWAGGGAGDNLRFVRTAQFARGRAWHDSVVAVVIESAEPIAVGSRHGWKPYGPPTTVTSARGVTVVELEYQSAFEIYRRTAAENGDEVDEQRFAAFAMTHPLGIPQADGDHVIRDPLEVRPDGSLRCVGEVPEGAMVRVMHGDRHDLLAAAHEAATAARGPGRTPAGALVFDCVSRALILGSAMERELEAIQEGIGRGIPMMGCLTLGEVGALGATTTPQFQNKTAVVMALPRAGAWT
ncbi:FIST signal transduction protein [Sandaracinus amylolyticus]|uniref:FIST domain-containing protein n=1 Tax=Sandaracinus amylolyticus TaxID=927083 RepID=A0A0F6SGL7_9BACT|nr:FIST N-terminal domain-containing protein [Sandaracinus amylolyticus]AKF08914.1 hypothetical protein DB32_006063 [Sandaracinus amylolyticus]